MPRQTPPRLLLGIGLAVLLVLGVGSLPRPTPGPQVRRPSLAEKFETNDLLLTADPSSTSRLGASYVGNGACVSCHQEIADAFHHHPMGRSLRPITEERDLPGLHDVTFEANGREYSASWSEGEYVHSEILRDDLGIETDREDAVIRYAIGSGTRGLSFLHLRDGGFLFQSPISWYADGNRHDLSPGFERSNPHFEREILPDCLSCHSGSFQSRGGIDSNQYDDPIFLDHAISCERCHGPGSLHVENLGRPDDDGRLMIINPSELAPILRESVCWQCHLGGRDYRLRAGATLADFRPGMSIEDVAILTLSPRSDETESLGNSALGHVGQLVSSRCFQESGGRLGCVSCHDPHQKPDPADRVAFFRARCLNCHGDPSSCALPVPDRLVSTPVDDCTSCHMPTAPMTDIAHAVRALHSIPRFDPSRE